MPLVTSVLHIIGITFCLHTAGLVSGLVTFEKTSNVFSGQTPFSIQSPVILAACIKTCLAEDNCQSISYAVPSLSCSRFNSTANDSSFTSRPNTYYFQKINFTAVDGVIGAACARRLWATERFPNKALYYDQSTTGIIKKTIEGVPFRVQCSELCLQEIDFVCQASQYNFTTNQCSLLAIDRRVDLREFRSTAQGVDYTENLCVPITQRCANIYTFERYRDIVFPPFYFDKTLSASSAAACSRYCLQEPEFPCRSFVFQAATQDCILSHNDRLFIERGVLPTLPRIYAAVLGRPLTEYYEFTCLPEGKICGTFSGLTRYSTFALDRPFQLNDAMSLQQCEDFCLNNQTSCSYLTYFSTNSSCAVANTIKPITGTPRGFVGEGDWLQNVCHGNQNSPTDNFVESSGSSSSWFSRSQRQPPPEQPTGLTSRDLTDSSTAASTEVTVTSISSTAVFTLEPKGSFATTIIPHSSQSSRSLVLPWSNATTATTLGILRNQTASSVPSLAIGSGLNQSRSLTPIDSDLTSLTTTLPVNGMGCRFRQSSGAITGIFVRSSLQNVTLDDCQKQCEATNSCLSFSYSSMQQTCLTSSVNSGMAPSMLNVSSDNDFVFYEKGSDCTNVKFECTDSQIVVTISTEKPFHGRLFVEGNPAPQCTARFNGQKDFSWAIPLSAEPCGTVYDGNGEFSSTITLQTHEVLVTKNDRRYLVNCKYDVGLLNVSSDALTVATPSTLTSLTVNPLPPPITIQITNLQGNPVQTAVLGDTLHFSVVIPENSPYGISAKNCYAFGAKENDRMQLTDETGCPVLPEFFRPFHLEGKTLRTDFDAFRFRNTYVITYQCTVNYCLDVCPQPVCGTANSTSHSRRKREESFLGVYNLRRQLVVDDSPEAGNSSLSDPGKAMPRQDICLTNTLVITLAVFLGSLLILNIASFLVAIRLHRRQKSKMREPLGPNH